MNNKVQSGPRCKECFFRWPVRSISIMKLTIVLAMLMSWVPGDWVDRRSESDGVASGDAEEGVSEATGFA